MGISISAYRAAIGLFSNCAKQRIVKCPKFFFTNGHPDFSVGVVKWSRYLYREKVLKKNIYSKLFLRNVIAGSLVMQMLLVMSGDVHTNPGPAQLTMCHANVRSLRSRDKLLNVKCDLAGKFDIITVSETWLSNKDDSDNFLLSGYQKPFRRDRSSGEGYGGVLAWVADHVPVKRRLDLEIHDIELMWLEIRSNNVKILVGVVYRAPNTVNDFWECLSDNIKHINENSLSRFIITGDLNADPSTRQGELLQAFVEEHSLATFVNEPTRITDVSSTVLDQCISNYPPLIVRCEVIEPVGNSDHFTIAIHCRCKIIKEKPYKRTMWQFNEASLDKFKNDVQLFDWEEQFDRTKANIDTCCEKWSETICH